jgi:hypothetical protein
MNLKDPLQTEKTPIFRKPIVVWYDSRFACLTTIVLMVLVFIFSLFGLAVAYETEAFREYIGLPISLCILSFFLVFKILFRLRRRAKSSMNLG